MPHQIVIIKVVYAKYTHKITYRGDDMDRARPGRHKNGGRLVRVNSRIDTLFRPTRLLAGYVYFQRRMYAEYEVS